MVPRGFLCGGANVSVTPRQTPGRALPASCPSLFLPHFPPHPQAGDARHIGTASNHHVSLKPLGGTRMPYREQEEVGAGGGDILVETVTRSQLPHENSESSPPAPGSGDSHLGYTLQESKAGQSTVGQCVPVLTFVTLPFSHLKVQVRKIQQERHQRPLLVTLLNGNAFCIQDRGTSCFLVVSILHHFTPRGAFHNWVKREIVYQWMDSSIHTSSSNCLTDIFTELTFFLR